MFLKSIVICASIVMVFSSADAQISRIRQARQVVNQANRSYQVQQQATPYPTRPVAAPGRPTSGSAAMGWAVAPSVMAHGASVYFNNRAGSVSSARGTAGQASTLGLSQAINMFYLDVGRLPRSNEGLSVLLYRPPGVSNWKGPYISVNSARGAFTDPWGNQYRYIDTTVRGGMPTFMIKSNGPDGLPDTADDLSVSG